MRWCSVGLSLCLLIQAVACGPKTAAPAEETRRYPLSIPPDRALRTFALSADGKYLAYSAESTSDQKLHLYVRLLDGAPSEADREIPGSTGAHNPFFSPDGNAVAFFSGGAIWSSAIGGASAGSAPRRIATAPTAAAGGTWTDDGRIVFAPLDSDGLMAVADSGGAATPLTTLNQRNAELEHGWPHALPNGAVLFTVSERGSDPHLETVSAAGQRKRQPVPAVGQAQFVSSGYLVYSYLGNLLAVAFDLEKLQTRGVPTPVAKGIQTMPGFGNLGRAGFALSRTGTLAWLPGSAEDARSLLVRVDRSGRYSPLPAPPEIYQSPRLSPDGRRIAVVVRPGVITRDIRVLDAASADRVVMTLSGGDNQSPAWMPDSRRLTFGSNRDGPQKIYVANITQRAREPKPVFSIDVSAPRNPASWARALPLMALYEIDPIRRRDVMIYRVGESVAPVAATAANERSPVLSPDGRWIAYVSDASSHDEIYVRRLDASSEPVQLTAGGGIEPVWTREGLFYRSGDRLLRVEWKNEKPTDPTEVLEGAFERDPGANLAAYDVDPKGQFFLMLKSASAPKQLRIITNWGIELASVVPAQR